jgi:hypothetical protein
VTFVPTHGITRLEIVERKKRAHQKGATVMRAVVIYESMYGNTRQIAEAIGTGLAGEFDVAVIPVAEARRTVISDADLLVAGGPTHMHGMAKPSTRRAAAKAADEPGSSFNLEPDALKPGLREWLDSLGKSKVHARAAAFDTRLDGPAVFTGRASKAVGRALQHHGYDLVAEPESFLVTKQNHLLPQERERAASWGARLAAAGAAAGSTTSVN